jgi:hypothetical protein
VDDLATTCVDAASKRNTWLSIGQSVVEPMFQSTPPDYAVSDNAACVCPDT